MCRRGELQIALCCCVRFSLNSPTFQIRPHFKFAPITNRLHVEGLIAISPYTGVIRTFTNMHVNTCKYTCKYTEKHHGHGVSMFTHVVGANCNSPILQFALVTNSPTLQIAHVFNCPHVEGLIAISPYTGVIRTFANIPVNTQKRHQGHGMRVFAYVVGANCNSPPLQIAHVTNRPYCKLPMLQITPMWKG